MSEDVKINLPKLGESILSATVVQWFKKVGDLVALDEPLLEVSTDKVNSEIPSPVSGVLREILADPDEEIQVGAPLAIITTRALASPSTSAPAPVSTPEAVRETTDTMEDFLSPSVLRLLREKGIPLDQIDRIPRTGTDGRLTKKDVELYQSTSPLPKPVCPKKSDAALEVERVKMSSLRKAIADNMVKSFYEAPHASLATEVDVTRIVKLIQEHKQKFQEKHGSKLSVTAFVARAISRALQSFPLINSSLDGDTIVMKRFVNLGVAVSVDQGVMVPVIRSCHSLSLPQISQKIAELAEKARTMRLSPQDVQEGTITMTNFGMTGTMLGIPIIRFPEVAIVGLGAIVKKVMAMPDDAIAIRSIMWISLTFDHRVLDGLYGCGFLNELKKHLEEDISLE